MSNRKTRKVCPGCGQLKMIDKRFVHCSRQCGCASISRRQKLSKVTSTKRMETASRWLGGKVDRVGYWYLKQPDGSYQAEHRVVIEKAIGRPTLDRELVHHWNENKKDNRLENLALFRHKSAHNRIHRFAIRHGIPVEKLKFGQPWLFAL